MQIVDMSAISLKTKFHGNKGLLMHYHWARQVISGFISYFQSIRCSEKINNQEQTKTILNH